jgi:hypothetical protein
MATITTRSGKGSPLTNTEVDDNFSNLNSAKYESGADPYFTGLTVYGPSTTVGEFRYADGTYNPRLVIQGSSEGITLYNGYSTAASNVIFKAVASETLRYNQTSLTINEGSIDIDFRVESNNDANAIFVNGANGRVGFGSNSPANVLDLGAATNNRGISWGHTSANYTNIWTKYSNANLVLATGLAPATNATGYVSSFQSASMGHSVLEIGAFGNPGELKFSSLLAQNLAVGTAITPVERFKASTTEFVVNDGSADYDFRVETDARTDAFFIDGSADTIALNSLAYINAAGSEAENGFTINNKGGVTGHLQFQTAENVLANDYVRANIVLSRDKNQIYWDNSTSEWVHAGGGSTDWSMMTHTAGEFRLYHGDAQASETRWTNGLFKNYYKVFEVAHASGMTFDLPNTGAFVFNERGLARDFRVESDTNEYALYINATTSSVGINTSLNYGAGLHVNGTTNSEYRTLFVSDTADASKGVAIAYDSVNDRGVITAVDVGTGWKPLIIENTSLTIDYGLVVNEVSSASADFRAESDTNTHMLFVDSSANTVGVGTSDTSYTLNVAGSTGTRRLVVTDDGSTSPLLVVRADDQSPWAFQIQNDTYSNTEYYGLRTYVDNSGGALTQLKTSGSARYRFQSGTDTSTKETFSFSDYDVVVNQDSSNLDFRVESDGHTHALLVDASANIVHFMGNTGGANNTSTGCYITNSGQFVCKSSGANYFNRTDADGVVIAFYRATASVGSIEVATTGTTYNTTSDRRLKENIETITDGTEKLMAMNPVTHTWKNVPEAPAVHGFIAQEMLEVCPEAVSGTPDGEEMMSMDYGRITPVLVAALQDAHKKIAELEARLNSLEGK